MIDTILTWSELPNLHPALVHFPISFTVLAVVFELAAVIRGRKEWLDKAATATWAAAGLGAWAAYWSGERAEGSIEVAAAVAEAMEAHSDWGHYTLYVLGAIALCRFALALWRPAPAEGRLWPSFFLGVGILASLVVLWAADLGGSLVYRHGVGVAPVTEAAPDPPPIPSPPLDPD